MESAASLRAYPAPRAQRARLALAALPFVVVGLSVLACSVGAVPISLVQVVEALLSGVGLGSASHDSAAILLGIRLPRVVLTLAVGAGLGVAGAVLQGLFRNPLADPALIGISTGAGLAVASALVLLVGLSVPAPLWLLPVAAFLGGLSTAIGVARFATVQGRTLVSTLLLAGVALNALFGAGIGLLLFLADDAALRDITFWTLGGFGGATWSKVVVAGPLLVLAAAGLLGLARPLNALALGEAGALHLGISVERVKRRAVWLSALAVGAGVAVAGAVGFIGLVVPHLWRLAFGPDHRFLLPGSALLGAALLVVADTLARSLVSPAELPVGVVTAFLGAPFFLWLLLQERAREAS